MRSKSIVVYSDLHIGSKLAICSPKVGLIDGEYKANKLQSAIYDLFTESIDELTQKPEIKIINGEPFDGINKKSYGSQSWSMDMSDQMNEAEKLIKMIPSNNALLIKGSKYHVDVEGSSFEEMFAKQIKATPYNAFGGSGYTDDFAQIEMNEKLFNLTHHIGFARWAAYRTTALAREMAALHFQKDKLGNIDVIIRSHVHYFVHVEFRHTHGFTTPAWKYPDRHLYRGGMGGVLPDIGCVEVIVEPNGKILIEKHIGELKIKPKVLKI